MWKTIQSHPVLSSIVAVAVFVLWTLPVHVATLWPVFVKDKTIPEWLAERRWPGISPGLYTSVAIVTLVVAGLIIALALIAFRTRTKSVQKVQSSVEDLSHFIRWFSVLPYGSEHSVFMHVVNSGDRCSLKIRVRVLACSKPVRLKEAIESSLYPLKAGERVRHYVVTSSRNNVSLFKELPSTPAEEWTLQPSEVFSIDLEVMFIAVLGPHESEWARLSLRCTLDTKTKHGWTTEELGTLTLPESLRSPPPFVVDGLQVHPMCFGISSFRARRGPDGRMICDALNQDANTPVTFCVSLKIRIVNRSESAASLSFALVGRASAPIRPESEMAVRHFYRVIQIPGETFFFDPVRVESKSDLVGILWFFSSSIPFENELPLEFLHVVDHLTGVSVVLGLHPDFRTEARRMSDTTKHGHAPMVFIR